METIPEKIEGIPTAKKLSKERVGLIRKYYFNLWKKLQRSGRGNKIFCNYLGVEVFIVESESDKKNHLCRIEKLAINLRRQTLPVH